MEERPAPPQQSGEPDRAVGAVVGVGSPTDSSEGVHDGGILRVVEGAADVGGHGAQEVREAADRTDL